MYIRNKSNKLDNRLTYWRAYRCNWWL